MHMIINDARSKLLFSLFGAMVGVLAARAETVSGTPDAYLDYPGHARVYKLKLSEKQQDGTYKLTRDFVPVMKDGKEMLFDRVSGTFFRNKGRYLAIGGGSERPFFVATRVIVR